MPAAEGDHLNVKLHASASFTMATPDGTADSGGSAVQLASDAVIQYSGAYTGTAIFTVSVETVKTSSG